LRSYILLIILFAVIVTFAIYPLIILVSDTVLFHSPGLLENYELLDLFWVFPSGPTLSVYLHGKVIHVDIVVIVAIIGYCMGSNSVGTKHKGCMDYVWDSSEYFDALPRVLFP